VSTALDHPLFSSTRNPPALTPAERPADQALPNLRLTGVVIEPPLHLAIFAVTGAKPLVLKEGETIADRRLDSIEPRQVSFSGPSGITTLELKTDPNIVRPAAPATQLAVPGRPPAPVAQTGPIPVGAPGRAPFPVPPKR